MQSLLSGVHRGNDDIFGWVTSGMTCKYLRTIPIVLNCLSHHRFKLRMPHVVKFSPTAYQRSEVPIFDDLSSRHHDNPVELFYITEPVRHCDHGCVQGQNIIKQPVLSFRIE